MKRSEHTPSFALDLGAHSIYKNNNVCIIEKLKKVYKHVYVCYIVYAQKERER